MTFDLMLGAALIGAAMVLSVILWLNRVIKLKWILGYASVFDVAFTAGVCALAGTVSGMYAGVLSGLLLTITLSVLRSLLGYKWISVSWRGVRVHEVPSVGLRPALRVRAALRTTVTWFLSRGRDALQWWCKDYDPEFYKERLK